MATILDDSTKIIRYMNLSKFLDLLVNKSLWFASMHTFSDEYEGRALIREEYRNEDAVNFFRNISQVSCWNHFQTESFPLWKIYLGGDKIGVAIVSTIRAVKESISDENLIESIEAYAIEYVDPQDSSDQTNDLIQVTIKKNFYQYENEIRFVHRDNSGHDNSGSAISIDVDKMVNQIILSPYTPYWAEKSIKDLVEKYGINPNKITNSIVKDGMLK
jgi:hypothetical protein